GGYDPDADLQYQVTASISVPNKKLKPNVDVTKPSDGTLEELLSNSENFPKTHPLENVRCRHLLEKEADITKEILEDNANSAYPLLHESALHLYIDFIEHKKQYGSKIENELYWNMTVSELVQRMVEKRALVFVGNWDFYELVSGATGHGKWEGIGTDEETHPLVLKDCLSYDEIKLSALLTVTSQSVFTNDGRRYNSGCVDPLEKIQRHGVVVGMVGPRLSHGPVMEYQEIIISEHQNTNENGYGHSATGKDKEKWRQLWADFYGVPTLELYEEVVQSLRVNEILARRFKNIGRGLYFDNEIFAKRISIAAETLLLEAESRSAAKNKRAYVHVVGLGLGAWLISPHEYQIYLDAFALCMKNLILVEELKTEASSVGIMGGYDPDADLQYQVTASISVPNKKLKPNVDVTKPSDGTLEELLSNSENFPKTHPLENVRFNEILARRFKNIGRGLYFDNEIFAKRISIAGETLLLEAESRAAAKNKRAYVYVVGLGLGAWLISPHEYQIYLDAFALCMKELSLVEELKMEASSVVIME
ncbi:hypothetical protein C0J52_19233, partial [Blattella germanica]